MPAHNVVRSEHQHDFVETQVQSGRYENASEVLCLIEQRERLGAAKLSALQEAANKGWADIDAGRYTDVADDQLEDFIGQMGKLATTRVDAEK